MTQLFDVDAVNIKTGASRKLAENKTRDDAEAIIRMAIARRGCDEEFYEAVPRGSAAPLEDVPNAWRMNEVETALASIAISLKRIADALEAIAARPI